MACKLKPELDSLDQRTKIEGEELVEELGKIHVCSGDLSKELKIGSELQPSIQGEIIGFLLQNLDIFTWNHKDMKRIDLKIACHRLNVDSTVQLRQQKCHPLNPDGYKVLNTEVQKLLCNRFIREAKYLQWIANSALLKKKNGDWKVCIDFTNLKKTCPKDSFSLPRID